MFLSRVSALRSLTLGEERVGLGSVWIFTRHLSELLDSVGLCYVLHVNRLLVHSFCLLRQKFSIEMGDFFLHHRQFVAPASCAAFMVVHSYTFTFKRRLRCSVLWKPHCTFKASSQTQTGPPPHWCDSELLLNVSLRENLISLSDLFSSPYAPTPLLLAALHACSHRYKGEILSIQRGLYSGVWGLEDVFFLKRGLTDQENNKQLTFSSSFLDQSSFN